MINFLLVFFLFISFCHAQQKAPESKYGLESGIDFRLIKRIRRNLLLLETRHRRELENTNYHQVLFGSYYRFTKKLRMGAFIQAERGLRWDEDWRRGPQKWEWQDVENRWDFSSVLDATYMDKFTGNFAWELKTRLYYYHSRDAVQLRLRPALRYFVMKFGRPLWHFYLELETYTPLTYGVNELYEYWIYSGVLYQATARFAIGPVLSFRERWFHAYEKFESRAGESFKTNFESTYLGLNAVYSF
jgi:hypothetical protein